MHNYLLFYLVVFGNIFYLFDCAPNENLLYDTLLNDYEPLERPVINNSAPLRVTFGFALQQIMNLVINILINMIIINVFSDEKNQIMEVNAWQKFSWIDYHLQWNASEHDNLTELRFRKHQLWCPDVLLYNSVHTEFDSSYATNMIVYSNGVVSWIPPGIFRISCQIDITWFPFDEQRCTFKYDTVIIF